jgi:hypothetical protein
MEREPRVRGSFACSIASLAAALGVAGGHVTAGGAPIFPILSYYQCGTTALAAASAGVDFFVEQPYTACSALEPNDFAADPPPPGVQALSDDYGDPAPAGGWYLPDEPDALAVTAAGLPRLPAASESGRLRVVNLSEHFFSGQAPIRPGYDPAEYGRLAAAADLIGFDLYPVVKFCGRIPLRDVFLAQRELITRYAGGRPTFQWIETGRMTGECPTLEVTPAVANAEAWLAVAGGAVGIGWFTVEWTPGTLWSRWAVDTPMLEQLQATGARLHALAEVLTAPWEPVGVTGASTVAASARTAAGERWVIAVNSTAEAVTATLRVPGLGARALAVLDEGRTVRANAQSVFRDRFEGYAVHLYKTG